MLKTIPLLFTIVALAAPVWTASPTVPVPGVQPMDLRVYTPLLAGESAIPVAAGDRIETNVSDRDGDKDKYWDKDKDKDLDKDKDKDQDKDRDKDRDKDKCKDWDDWRHDCGKPPHPSPHF
jgi:hypothetical protein